MIRVTFIVNGKYKTKEFNTLIKARLFVLHNIVKAQNGRVIRYENIG